MKKAARGGKEAFFVPYGEKNIDFCLHFKEKHYFCPVINK